MKIALSRPVLSLLLGCLLLALPFVAGMMPGQKAPGIIMAARHLLSPPDCRTIGIIPLGKVTDRDVAEVAGNIREFFHADVILLDADTLPRSAYYKPRGRYRADSLLS